MDSTNIRPYQFKPEKTCAGLKMDSDNDSNTLNTSGRTGTLFWCVWCVYLILDPEVLTMVRHNLSLKTKSQYKKRLLTAANPANKTWHYTSNKKFTSW
ncbi:hypothetical protein PR048_001947, partial [Dryococelus australis]